MLVRTSCPQRNCWRLQGCLWSEKTPAQPFQSGEIAILQNSPGWVMSSVINQCVVSFLVEFITVIVFDGWRNNRGLGGLVCIPACVCTHAYMCACIPACVSGHILVCLYLCVEQSHMWTCVCMCLGGEIEKVRCLINSHCLGTELFWSWEQCSLTSLSYKWPHSIHISWILIIEQTSSEGRHWPWSSH